MERKGFGPRLLALLIDVAVQLVLFCAVGMFAGGAVMFTYGSGAATSPTTGSRVGAIIGAILGLAYASTEIFLAGTPGKLILKMKIGDEAGLVPAPQDMLIRRWLVKWSPALLNFLFALTFFRPFSWLAGLASLVIVVGFFFSLGLNRQALHDTLAHTAVYGTGAAMAQGFQPIMGGGGYGTGVAPGRTPGAGPGAAPYPPGAGQYPPDGPGAPPPPPPPPSSSM